MFLALGSFGLVSILAQRLTAQLLAGSPARDPVAVVRRLLAIQAQDGRGARLAVRSRSTGLTVVDPDTALTDARSLLVTWLDRGTLHLVRSEDYPWLQALTAPRLATTTARRLSQEGVSPNAGGTRPRCDRADVDRRGPARPRPAARPGRGRWRSYAGTGVRSPAEAGVHSGADRSRSHAGRKACVRARV